MMMTFGHMTLIDALSWIIVLTLGLKLLATVLLLTIALPTTIYAKARSALWWSTKITPLIAVPCFIWLCACEGMTDYAWLGSALMVFVVIAVPFKIAQRRHRMVRNISPKRFRLS
jgi:hypothetical protein